MVDRNSRAVILGSLSFDIYHNQPVKIVSIAETGDTSHLFHLTLLILTTFSPDQSFYRTVEKYHWSFLKRIFLIYDRNLDRDLN